jgi:hypothetical protein
VLVLEKRVVVADNQWWWYKNVWWCKKNDWWWYKTGGGAKNWWCWPKTMESPALKMMNNQIRHFFNTRKLTVDVPNDCCHL